MPKKICILTDHHISYNPRVWKEAFIWEKLGYEVVILNMWISEQSLERDLAILKDHTIRYECYLNLIPAKIPKGRHYFYRIRKRIFAELQKRFKVGLKWTLSYAPEKMISCAIKEQADFYSAHLECAFFAGRELSRKGMKVFFDFEDWYSRDYLVPERPVTLLRKLENFALNKGLFCITTSNAMASALAGNYNSRKPAVIYNGFSALENVTKQGSQQLVKAKPRFIWFSRTVGANRGIERFVELLRHLKTPVELHLLGESSEEYRQEVISIFPSMQGHSLHFHDFLPHEKLTGFLSEFDLGLAIEENINDNKELTISNKILQYLQAGIKVLATKTEGQVEVQQYFPSQVEILQDGDSNELHAAQVEQWLRMPAPDPLKGIQIFNEIFSQEAQEKKLTELADTYLK